VFGGIAVLVYDYALLIGEEVELMWSTKFRLSTLLYFIIRYPVIARLLFYVFHTDGEYQCTQILRFGDALSVLSNAAANIVLVARTYAISGKNKPILVITGFLGTSVIGLNCFLVGMSKCDLPVDPPSLIIANVASSFGRILFDLIVVVVTIFHTIRMARVQRQLNRRHTLAGLILQSGSVYFCTVLMVALGSILSAFFMPAALKGMLAFADIPAGAILISRFLIDLRRCMNEPTTGTGTTLHDTSLSTFRAAVGSAHSRITDEFSGPVASSDSDDEDIGLDIDTGHQRC